MLWPCLCRLVSDAAYVLAMSMSIVFLSVGTIDKLSSISLSSSILTGISTIVVRVLAQNFVFAFWITSFAKSVTVFTACI